MSAISTSDMEQASRRLNRRVLIAMLIWIIPIASLYTWQSFHVQSDSTELATQEAIANLNRDQVLLFWATAHGGLYAPTNEDNPPNPWLSHIPDRVLTSPSGQQFTLMSPANILIQVMEEYEQQFAVKERLVSNFPLNPENETDEWEEKALRSVQDGTKEVIEVVEFNGKPHLRLLRPVVSEKGCIKCHAIQSDQAGNIRGGISIAVDMSPYIKRQQIEMRNRKIVLLTICALGLAGLLIGWYRGSKRIREKMLNHQELQESDDKFHSISDAALDAVVAIDEQGEIRYWNKSAERIFGHTNEEAMGRNLHQLIVPERYHQAHIDGWSHFIESGEGAVIGKTLEVTALDHDGDEFPVELSISAIRIQGKWQAVGVIRDIRERRQAEGQISDINKKIERAHREWVDAFDSINDPIFLHDKHGLIMRANRAYASQAGVPIEALIGKPYWDFFPKGEGPLQSCTIDRTPVDSGEHDEEINLENGNILLSRAFAISNEDGSYRYSIHIMEDITFERRAKQTLRESEDRFRKLFEKAPLAYHSLDNEGCILEVNQAWEELFGYERAQVLGNPFEQYLTEKCRDEHQNNLHPCASQSNDKATELEIRCSDGSERIIATRGRFSYDQNGKEIISHCILTDITERKHAEERLEKERMRAQSYLDIAPVIILVLNIQGEITLINRQGSEVLGYQEHELIGQNWFEFCIPHYLRDHLQLIFEELIQDDSENLDHFENTVITKSGEERLIYWRNSVLRNQSGEVTALLSSGEDITERKESEKALRHLNQMLQTTQACNEALVRATEEPVLIQQICDILAKHSDFSLVWVGLSTPSVNNDTSVYSSDSCESIELFNSNWHEEEGPCPAKEAIRTGKIQVIHATDNDPTFKAYRDKVTSIGCFSLAALPLQNKGQSLGIMMVYSYKADVFDQQQIGLLEELSNDLAYGITSIRLHAERDHMGQRLERNLLQTVEAIAHTLESRDPYTAGHQRRVTELSIAIAKEMELDEQQIEGIRFGATVHDIGKIHIPAEILNRPGRLSEMEFSIIKTHAEVGNDIIKEIEFPWPVSEMIYQHHERLDGSGYPRGLKEDEIILEAKILAVADVVEAMSSHRPYRAGLGIDAALEELKKNRGIFYDPEITDVCIRLFDENLFQFSDSF
ncbi:MAG: PAS domain S-box protein [Gammaproteobacteria bacterium]|nr:PAS domain S-box protein [Gammaproteobacteria bacterium]